MAFRHENTALLERPKSNHHQLELVRVESKPPAETELSRKQRANFEATCANLRQQRDAVLAIAQRLYPDAGYTRAQDIKNDHWRTAWAEFHAAPIPLAPVPIPHPELLTNYHQLAQDLFSDTTPTEKPKKKSETVYRPWSLERRQNAAARALMQRASKRYSLPELRHEWLQAKLLKDPHRFGVCPLPSENICQIPDPGRELRKQQAISREIQFRQQERGLVQPLLLPVAVPEREYAYAQEVAYETRI